MRSRQSYGPLRDSHDRLDESLEPSISGSGSIGQLGDKIVKLCQEILSRSKTLRVFLGLGCLAGLGWILRLSWESFSGTHWLWLFIFVCYAYVTETKRIRLRGKEIKGLREKCRKLVQARRAAGLLRLEKDTRMRREHWPAPPHSGAKAYLFKELDAMDSPKIRDRQVNYKQLCIQIAQEFLQPATASASTSFSTPVIPSSHKDKSGSHSESQRLRTAKSLFRLLSQAGPEPVKDAELYRDMHLALDEVERQIQSNATQNSGGFYCRLCLGYQKASPKSGPVTLKCGHNICRECSHSLVESSISGAIGVPISCPVGCNSLMSPHMLRSHLSEDVFERFQRIHTVKMSLQASAPHVRSLATELAEARKGLAAKRRNSKGGDKPTSTNNTNANGATSSSDLTLRTSATKEASGSGSRFADTSSLNHRVRFK